MKKYAANINTGNRDFKYLTSNAIAGVNATKTIKSLKNHRVDKIGFPFRKSQNIRA